MDYARLRVVPRVTSLLTATALAVPGGLSAQAAKFDAPIVSTQWLSEHLADPSVVVLHLANVRRDYAAGHVPGARFLWINDIAPSTPDLNTELPPVARLDSLLESLGVSDNSRVVVYAPTVSTMAARVYMTLDYLGLGDRAAVLDGGLNAWKAEGRPVSTDAPVVKRGKFTPHVHADAVVDADFVKASIDKPGIRILDARDPGFYAASNTGPMSGGYARPGHIQSALNIPFSALTDSTGHLKDKATIAGLFTSAGVQPSDRVITYCHVGQQGSLLFLAARYAGYKPSLYDGSYEDWSPRGADYPVVGPTAKK
jgi:thiosulfate/3-mercaptopyruvate sulfurtransferase